LVFNGESIAHSGGGVEHFGVSFNFSGSGAHNNLFFKDTVGHVINVGVESNFESGKVSEGGFEVGSNGVVFFELSGFSSL